jgi:succinyl-CoA synthetase alpha subunit
MAILIDENTRVCVQGITGREGRLRARLMQQSGTVICAGVTPGRGGEKAGDVPVYNSVAEAIEHHPEINASKDMLETIAVARARNAIVVGPNSPGILSPGKCSLGGLGGRIEMMRTAFKPGPVGIISRSGGNTMTLAYYLTKSGFGQSTAVGVGGDAFVGASWRMIMGLFEKDAETKLVVAYGEIGGVNEEEAAEAIASREFSKPFVAYIGGGFAREGMRFGHAGAVISGNRGTAAGKIAALRAAGAIVVDHLDEIGPAVAKALGPR